MKQRLFIVLGLAVLIVVLIGLNAVSYTQKEKQLDTEFMPNRSTYNTGATGTRAFFDLLTETGRKPVRWQDAPADLLLDKKNRPSTFVIIGQTRREITDEDAGKILQWVAEGGKLVVIDRDPPPNLVKTSANWRISFNNSFSVPGFSSDASDQTQMTTGIRAAKPVQPTVYTKGINAAQPSRYAASVNFARLSEKEIDDKTNPQIWKPSRFPANTNSSDKPGIGRGESGNSSAGDKNGERHEVVKKDGKTEKLIVKDAPLVTVESDNDYALTAPVAHFNADGRNILVDVPYGAGRIVFLSDPYIVANGGINLVDNARLAVNVVASREGIIAFDEYHQGFGTNNNRLIQFFAGTPVIPIFVQIALLVGLIFFSQSRRFARAVPEPEPDRLSKLEYVSAMAELQQRTKGYDLAIENIYTDFRRRVSRLVGVDALKTRKQDLALLIVERLPNENAVELEQLMEKCEDVMHGGKTSKKQVLRLTTRLRELEEKLGLQRRKKSKK